LCSPRSCQQRTRRMVRAGPLAADRGACGAHARWARAHVRHRRQRQATGFFIYDVWDPSAGLAGGHLTLPNMTGTDIFCSSQLVLAQTGSIFLAGGDNFVNGATTNTGNNNTNVYTPADDSLTRGNNMNRSRWYSSSTTLLNGEVYIQGGSGGADLPEVRSTTGIYRLLPNAVTSALASNFPRNFIAPDGRIFGFDTSGKMYYVSPGGNGLLEMA